MRKPGTRHEDLGLIADEVDDIAAATGASVFAYEARLSS